MEGLLTNNFFFIYLLGVLVIINYEAFEKRQKISIIYACSYGLTFNKDLRCGIILVLLMFILFLYEEYLSEDLVKIQYVTKINHKIIDFLFMYLFQYNILFVIAAIVLKSQVCNDFLKQFFNTTKMINVPLDKVLFVLSIACLITGVHLMFNNPIELNSFKEMNKKFSEYPYYFLNSEKMRRDILFEKLKMVADIEDYTFFERRKSYSCLSIEFITAIIRKKKNEKQYESQGNVLNVYCVWKKLCLYIKNFHVLLWFRQKRKFKKIKRAFVFLVKYLKQFVIKNLQQIKKSIKRYIRGYSTIEMQLIRIISFKKGLKMGRPKGIKEVYLVVIRKIFEVIYAPVFFKGMKNYLFIPKEKDYFRYYIIYVYLHTVQTNLNGSRFSPLDKVFNGVDVVDWPTEALFVVVLGLNNMRITRERVKRYIDIIEKHSLDIEIIYQLVDSIATV